MTTTTWTVISGIALLSSLHWLDGSSDGTRGMVSRKEVVRGTRTPHDGLAREEAKQRSQQHRQVGLRGEGAQNVERGPRASGSLRRA